MDISSNRAHTKIAGKGEVVPLPILISMRAISGGIAMNMQSDLRKAVLLITISVALLTGLAACRPQETELSFETLEQKNDPDSTKRWEGQEPRLLIITNIQDVEEASRFVTDEAIAALHKLDFATQFAILAFRGFQGNHAGFKIERGLRRGNEIVLYAQPGTGSPATIVISSYHYNNREKRGKLGCGFHFQSVLRPDRSSGYLHHPSCAIGLLPV